VKLIRNIFFIFKKVDMADLRLERLATGNQESMRNNIGQERILNIRTPFPPSLEQEKIVEENRITASPSAIVNPATIIKTQKPKLSAKAFSTSPSAQTSAPRPQTTSQLRRNS
jgi:hypothetical protein